MLSVACLLAAGCSKKVSAKVDTSDDGTDIRRGGRAGGEGDWEDDSPETDTEGFALDGRPAEPHALGAGVGSFATLPGFHMFRDGRSRVFIEMGGDVAVDEGQAQGQLVYRLRGVKVPEKVNLFDLPTTHFNTPVSLVRLLQTGDDAQLVIELRRPARHKTHVQKASAGTVLSVDFPPTGDTDNAPPPAEGEEHKAVEPAPDPAPGYGQ